MVYYWFAHPWVPVWVFIHPYSYYHPGGGKSQGLPWASSASHVKAVIQACLSFIFFGGLCFAMSVNLSNKCPFLHWMHVEMFCSHGWILSHAKVRQTKRTLESRTPLIFPSVNSFTVLLIGSNECKAGYNQHWDHIQEWPKDFKKLLEAVVFYLYIIKFWTAYVTWPEEELLLTFSWIFRLRLLFMVITNKA